MDRELQDLFLNQTLLIDVRAPSEFKDGNIPGSINIPILDDLERALVGTCYKIHGQDEAIKLGHELVNGKKKEQRVQSWANQIAMNPSAKIICFRGGLRSKMACIWLKEVGINCSRVEGGYKRLRQYCIEVINDKKDSLMRLAGLTGSGKTELLQDLPYSIDLEKMASHRGSVFGDMGGQPSQANFENDLARKLLIYQRHPLVIEDEGRTIGKILLPTTFYEVLRRSPLILLEVDYQTRISNIYHDYVCAKDCEFFLANVDRIKTKLSTKIFQKIRSLIQMHYADKSGIEGHGQWISILLEHYYDPLYLRSLKRDKSLIIFKGTKKDILEYWNDLNASKTLKTKE